VASAAGVSPREVSNLIVGRPVKANAFLRLCAALRHDPLPDLPHSPLIYPADFDHVLFAMACKMKRAMNQHTVGQAGDVMDMSGFTVSRVENGHITSIGVVLKVCRYVGVHAFQYFQLGKAGTRLVDRVSRETLLGTPNKSETSETLTAAV
jgi:hypothetical protein